MGRNWAMTQTKANQAWKRKCQCSFWHLKTVEQDGIEFQWPGYQYMGPSMHLKERLKRGHLGISRLDKIAKQHDIDYSHAQNLEDKWKADAKMIKTSNMLPRKKTVKTLLKMRDKISSFLLVFAKFRPWKADKVVSLSGRRWNVSSRGHQTFWYKTHFFTEYFACLRPRLCVSSLYFTMS